MGLSRVLYGLLMHQVWLAEIVSCGDMALKTLHMEESACHAELSDFEAMGVELEGCFM